MLLSTCNVCTWVKGNEEEKNLRLHDPYSNTTSLRKPLQKPIISKPPDPGVHQALFVYPDCAHFLHPISVAIKEPNMRFIVQVFPLEGKFSEDPYHVHSVHNSIIFRKRLRIQVECLMTD